MVKFLAFTDTHGWRIGDRTRLARIIRDERCDFVVCAGDFTIMGANLSRILAEMDAWGVPVVFIHGNHEDASEVERAIVGRQHLLWAHERAVSICGLTLIGYGGGGFRSREPGLERLERDLTDRFDERTIVISHAPPEGTTLDDLGDEWHVGCASLSELIRRRRPMLVLCGHIHECFGRRDTLAGTLVVNPGPDGEVFEVPDA